MNIELELQKLENLRKKRISIARKLDNGTIDEESAQELFEPVSKAYNKLYKEIEKFKVQQYDVFVATTRTKG